ncbi:C3a anaphylatoxin chemotactic receptor-like [Menidia menidia]
MGAGNTVSTAPSSGLELTVRRMSTVTLVLYCMIFVVGVLGNSLVIYVTGFRMKRTVNSVWFLNLALADFLFTAFLIFSIVSLYQDLQWPFGEFMCKLNNFVSVVNMFASIFLLTAISLDRCVSIWVVVWAQNKRTVQKSQILSTVIWVMAGTCSIPFATFREVVEHQGKKFCGYRPHVNLKSLCVVRFVLGFLIPFMVIFISCVAIGIRAKRLQRKRRRRTLRILFSVVTAFFICWLPFHAMSFVEVMIKDKSDFTSIIYIGNGLAVSLAFMNSCLNPILYVFLCDEFQKKIRQSICFVLESALAEDRLYASSQSLSSHLSRISRKSDSVSPVERTDTITSLNFTERKVFTSEGTQSPREDVEV